jgi:hypothetical protein
MVSPSGGTERVKHPDLTRVILQKKAWGTTEVVSETDLLGTERQSQGSTEVLTQPIS